MAKSTGVNLPNSQLHVLGTNTESTLHQGGVFTSLTAENLTRQRGGTWLSSEENLLSVKVTVMRGLKN